MSSLPEVVRNCGRPAKGKNAEGSNTRMIARLVASQKARRLSSCN